MKAAPAFQFYPADFLMGTALMTCEQRGAFMSLLCHQWHSLGLPSENRMLSRLAGCEVETIEAIRSKFDLCSDGLLRNKRLEAVRDKQDAYRESRSKSGLKGGRPKKHTLLKTKAQRKHTESSLYSVLCTSSPTPSSSSLPEDPPLAPAPPSRFEQIKIAYVSAWEENFKAKYQFDGGRDGKALKTFAGGQYPVSEIIDRAKLGWRHPTTFIAQNSATIHGLFTVFNNIIATNGNHKSERRTDTRSREIGCDLGPLPRIA